MLSIKLEPHDEEEWLGENPSPATFPSHPLYHQWLTYKAESPLIINAYNTGTGKTKAAFLRLLKRAEEKNFNLDSSEDNVLLIAPTNELLAQHARDAEKFCNDNKLPYRVLSMSRATLDEIQNKPDFSEGKLRRGQPFMLLWKTHVKRIVITGKGPQFLWPIQTSFTMPSTSATIEMIVSHYFKISSLSVTTSSSTSFITTIPNSLPIFSSSCVCRRNLAMSMVRHKDNSAC
jgi:DEAD/DEAH box helicase